MNLKKAPLQGRGKSLGVANYCYGEEFVVS